ncbi:MAG TPA: GDP-mannose 4,6-dehydratase [Tepidiformaceae bacterium]
MGIREGVRRGDVADAPAATAGRLRDRDGRIATGEMHSVRELCEVAFGLVGLDWQRYVRIDAKYLRPTEVEELCGDASKARERLDWQAGTTFRDLVRLMLEHDLADAGLPVNVP